MSNYPRDEFDRIPESSSRQGVHRAGLEPPRNGGLALVITVGLIVLLIGAAAFFLFPRLGWSGDNEPAAAETETSQQTGAGGQATADAADNDIASTKAAGSDGGTQSAETADESADTTDSAAATTEAASDTESPTSPAVDKSTGVVVLNATNVTGLAGTASNRLSAEGWPVTFTGNWSGQPQPSSVIFYNGGEQLANAQALAGSLGVDRLVNTSTLGQPLTIVLGPGFG